MNIGWKSYTGRAGCRVTLLVGLMVSACGTSADPLGVDDLQNTDLQDEPTVASIRVSPDGVDLALGESRQLAASAYDASGTEIATSSTEYDWSTSNGSLVSVTDAGEVTAVAEGSASVTATLAGHSGTALVVSFDPDAGPLPSDWDFVLQDTFVVGDVVVPDGEVWLIGANVEVEGNVRTMAGTVAMRPGSSLRFLGGNPNNYVGGGLMFGPEFSDDIGLWIGRMGVLDIRGTPKQGWNRTGTHSTWGPGDEYWIAPTEKDDYTPRRWFPGNPIPQIDPRVPATEVLNVTRDIVIEGPGHIHIHSQKPQRIEYVRIEGMGVLRNGGPVLGRYALHMHHGGDGTRGTMIQGVALVNSKGRGFVPHESHGITMIDNVALNTWADAFWWDEGDETNDLLVDRMAIVGVGEGVTREMLGETPRFDGFFLGSGLNMEIRNSVAAGVCCNTKSVGFNWITGGRADNPIWIFDTGNVSHNNTGPGLRFWTNLSHDHSVRDYVSYRNENGGIENGAYFNRVNYHDVILVDDWIKQNASPRDGSAFINVEVHSPREAMIVGQRNLVPEPGVYMLVQDCVLNSAPGFPKVFIQALSDPDDHDNGPARIHFVRSGVVPDDIVFEDLTGGNEGSHILIDHEDGRKWEIRVENGQRIVNQR